MKHRVLLYLMMALAETGISQPVQVLCRQYTAQQGLFQGPVKRLAFHRFLYAGGAQGISRFDGSAFQSLLGISHNPKGLDMDVMALGIQHNGSLWTSVFPKGWYSYADSSDRMKPACPKPPFYFVKTANQMPAGDWWVSTDDEGHIPTQGLYHIDKQGNTLAHYPLSDSAARTGRYHYGKILCSLLDGNTLWLGTWRGLVKFDLKTKQYQHINNNLLEIDEGPSIVISLYKQGEKLWLGTWGGGLVSYTISTGQFSRFVYRNIAPLNGRHNIVSSIAPLDSHRLWVCSFEAGLWVFNIRTETFSRPVAKTPSENELLTAPAHCMIKQPDGTVWVGTGTEGLLRITPIGSRYETYELRTKNRPKMVTGSLTNVSNAVIVTGYYGNSPFLIKNGQNAQALLKPSAPLCDFYEPIRYSSGFWIPSSNGVWQTNENGNDLTRLHKAPTLLSSGWEQYITTDTGTWFLRNEHLEFYDLQGKPKLSRNLNNLFSETKGKPAYRLALHLSRYVWLGFYAKGVGWLDLETGRTQFVPRSQLPDENIRTTLCDPLGNLWIGTYSGLARLHPLNGRIEVQHLTPARGFAFPKINDLCCDDKGNLWVATDAGLACLHIATQQVTWYYSHQGLYVNEVATLRWMPAMQKLAIGFDGAVQFISTRPESDNPVPELYLKGLYVAGNKADSTVQLEFNPQITLSHSSNYFEIQFGVPCFDAPEQVIYRYRLGSDKSWVSLGSSHRVAFSGLPGGDYVLQLQAQNLQLGWQTAIREVGIYIIPPVWQRWWFYVLMAAALATVVWFVFRYRIRQLKKQMELRNKIARDLHDDVGSTLSSIALISNRAKRSLQKADNTAAEELMQRIEERSHTMMGAMSDIVWSINPLHDRGEDLLVRMKEFAAEKFDRTETEYHFENNGLEQLKLNPGQRKELILIYKETVNNVAKYAQCSRVEITLTYQSKCLTLEVRDNGKGFDNLNHTNGNGLRNMQQRAAALGGKLTVISGEGVGTAMLLTVPLH